MWKIEQALWYKTEYLEELLRAGYEPFAVTEDKEWGVTIWLRIKID